MAIDRDQPSLPTARPRVLLVEDDPAFARCLQRALTDHDVVTELESRRALARIENGERYDVIVTKFATPKLSGAELYAEIKKLDHQQAEKMLFLTGGVSTRGEQELLQSLANPQLINPFEMSALRRSIAKMISANDFSRAAASQSEALETLAKKFDLAALEGDPSSAALVDRAGSILWVNAAWHAYGTGNGANPERIAPGQNYFGAISGELRVWFSEITASCVTSGEAFESNYECSSPDMKRDFRMRILPVTDAGLLITHSFRLESAQPDGADPNLTSYTRDGEMIVMCSNCRRVRRADQGGWDWVPGWLTHAPLPVSHGLCHLCVDFYYSGY